MVSGRRRVTLASNHEETMMAGSEWKPDVHNASSKATAVQWPWYLAVIFVVGTIEPLVDTVRHGSENYVGHWLAYVLGILAAAVAALPLFAVLTWVIRREQSNQFVGIATMIYRPAALPGLTFLGAILKGAPSSFTEIAAYGFLGAFVFLIAISVIMQKRRAHVWSWSFAILIGFGIGLLATLAGGILSLTFGQRP